MKLNRANILCCKSYFGGNIKRAVLQTKLPGGRVQCGTCIRGCSIPPGLTGLCGNYENIDGVLYNVGYGMVSAIESRPIEIKPFFHFWPGSSATTFSGWGCNFLCPWCQNWSLSKARPPKRDTEVIEPEKVIDLALRWGDDGVCASFNEPTVHLEYLLDVFKLAKSRGLYTTMVSNGSLSKDALKLLKEVGLDAINIDIKGCPETYRKYVGISNFGEVLETAKYALELGIHVEAVFLIVTGANDWDSCIEWVLNSHIKYLGVDTPLHINRYYPAYKYTELPTPMSKLVEAYMKAKKMGIKYVYIGNTEYLEFLYTKCPNCGEVLIKRTHYGIISCNLVNGNKCPRCGEEIKLVGFCRV